MLLLLTFILFVIVRSQQNTTYYNWVTGTVDVYANGCNGRCGANAAIAYNDKDNTILLIGGDDYYGWGNERSFATYSIAEGNFADNFDVLSYNMPKCGEQCGVYWAQHQMFLYYVNDANEGFNRINIETMHQEINWSPPFPIYARDVCITYLDKDDGYLIAVGGRNQEYESKTDLQIFDVSSHSWLTNLPSMTYGRWFPGCAVYDGRKLFSIGGRYKIPNSGDYARVEVEVLDLGDMQNIHSQQWREIQPLDEGTFQPNIIVNGMDILVLSPVGSLSIAVINGETEAITVKGKLQYHTYDTASINVNNVIYIFGGMTNRYQYLALPAPASTEYCCSANVAKSRYHCLCTNFFDQEKCLRKVDTKSGEKACQWIDCNYVGYCQWDGVTGTAQDGTKQCVKQTDIYECQNIGFCVWKTGSASDQFLDVLDDALYSYDNIRNDPYKNDILALDMNVSGTDTKAEAYGILLFAIFCILFAVYSGYKCKLSKEVKFSNEAETTTSSKFYGSV